MGCIIISPGDYIFWDVLVSICSLQTEVFPTDLTNLAINVAQISNCVSVKTYTDAVNPVG